MGHGTFNYRGELPNADGSYTFPLTGQFLSGATLDQNRVPSYAVFGLAGSYQFDNVGPGEELPGLRDGRQSVRS